MLMEIFPQHSVMPYETKNSHPNRAIARLTIVGGNGELVEWNPLQISSVLHG